MGSCHQFPIPTGRNSDGLIEAPACVEATEIDFLGGFGRAPDGNRFCFVFFNQLQVVIFHHGLIGKAGQKSGGIASCWL